MSKAFLAEIRRQDARVSERKIAQPGLFSARKRILYRKIVSVLHRPRRPRIAVENRLDYFKQDAYSLWHF